MPPQAAYPDNFRVDYALSREQTNLKGGKMYIQDKMEEYADEIFGLLDQVRSLFVMGQGVMRDKQQPKIVLGIINKYWQEFSLGLVDA